VDPREQYKKIKKAVNGLLNHPDPFEMYERNATNVMSPYYHQRSVLGLLEF